MTTYIVAYDLKAPGKAYDKLIDYLNSFSTSFHIQGSVWIIVTSLAAKEIRDGCTAHMDANDKIIVAKIGAPGAWRGYTSADDWLKKYLV